MLNVKAILESRGYDAVRNIVDNIKYNRSPASPNDVAWASGTSANTTYAKADNNSLSIYGYEYLEKGYRGKVDFERIFQWTFDKQLLFENQTQRRIFSARVVRKILKFGTNLYEINGREDIYTNEIEPLVQNIANDLGKAITDIQIVKG